MSSGNILTRLCCIVEEIESRAGVPEMSDWRPETEEEFHKALCSMRRLAEDEVASSPSTTTTVEDIYTKRINALLAAGPVKYLFK